MPIDKRFSGGALFASFVLLWTSSAHCVGGDRREFDPGSTLLGKLKRVAPARVQIQRRFDNGLRLTTMMTVVDLAKDGTASAIAFTADIPQQQSIWLLGREELIYYLNGVIGADGRIKPATREVQLTATIFARRGKYDHPAADAFQINHLRILDDQPIPVMPDGMFSVTNSEGTLVAGRFNANQGLFESVKIKMADGRVMFSEYASTTNFHDCILPTSMRLTASLGEQSSESYYSFTFQKSHDLLPADKNLDPPVGCLVEDQRFGTSLTYRAEKEHYSKEDLTVMHRTQKAQGGAIVPTPGRGPRPRWFQFVALLAAVGLPLLLAWRLKNTLTKG